VTGAGLPSVEQAVALYAAGWFPMDDAGSGELPWYAAEQRAIFELDRTAREHLARKVRRSLRACDGFVLRVDRAYDRVLDLCATPPPGERAWISERLKVLYRRLHAAGFSHTFELWTPRGELAAGILAVALGRAALLESMRRVRPHAGNALLSRTVDRLAQMGATLCDVQIATDHTMRLGARELPRQEFDARLRAALGGGLPDCEHGAR
jgi:leucyl/phenylalanyl-tRNA--protein transferase